MFQILGWIGAVILLGTQFALANKKMTAGQAYYLLNTIAAVLLGLSAWEVNNFPTVATNIAWIAIAINGIRKQRQTRGQ